MGIPVPTFGKNIHRCEIGFEDSWPRDTFRHGPDNCHDPPVMGLVYITRPQLVVRGHVYISPIGSWYIVVLWYVIVLLSVHAYIVLLGVHFSAFNG